MRTWLSIGPDGRDEAAYRQNAGLINVVVPVRGAINADGTWAERYPYPFARELPGLARANGQRYEPSMNSGHGENWLNFYSVLDDENLWPIAADNLVELATRSGYDAPWDGVVYDMIFHIKPEYKERSERFTRLLYERVAGTGLSFVVNHAWILPEDTDNRHGIDLLAEMDGLECTSYMCPYENSFSPLWWPIDSMPNMLSGGMNPANIYFSIGNFGQYWPINGTMATLPFDAIMDLLAEYGAQPIWVERGERGLMRLPYANAGGDLWFMDAQAFRARLAFVDEMNLAGINIFRASTGDPAIWQVIADWKRPRRVDRYHGTGMKSSIGSKGGYLVPGGRIR